MPLLWAVPAEQPGRRERCLGEASVPRDAWGGRVAGQGGLGLPGRALRRLGSEAVVARGWIEGARPLRAISGDVSRFVL